MLRTDLEIGESRREITLDSPAGIGDHLRLRVVIVASNPVRMNAMQNFVKSRMAYFELSV